MLVRILVDIVLVQLVRWYWYRSFKLSCGWISIVDENIMKFRLLKLLCLKLTQGCVDSFLFGLDMGLFTGFDYTNYYCQYVDKDDYVNVNMSNGSQCS